MISGRVRGTIPKPFALFRDQRRSRGTCGQRYAGGGDIFVQKMIEIVITGNVMLKRTGTESVFRRPMWSAPSIN